MMKTKPRIGFRNGKVVKETITPITDTQRLDWLQGQSNRPFSGWDAGTEAEGFSVRETAKETGMSVREAIDEAMFKAKVDYSYDNTSAAY
jgi:hypothetical protein